MIFQETKIGGAYRIEPERKGDTRGFFARVWCEKEAEAHGLTTRMVQSNISFNEQKGTLRGMHYQAPPHEEAKLVRCTAGAIYDVIVDLRPESSTFTEWIGAELTADNHRMLYVPERCAHGYITLEDAAEVMYQVSAFYAPEAERGVRYDDSAFNIQWPMPVQNISSKDKSWEEFAVTGD